MSIQNTIKQKDTWVFGYGSLIWLPSFIFKEQRPARIYGWARKFWQGSHDHRGLPHAPGRVVTLIPAPGQYCDGVAYLLAADTLSDVFEHLDYREKNGYTRLEIELIFPPQAQPPNLPPYDEPVTESGLIYIATKDNPAYLGPASLEQIARQILHSTGPSGSNIEYLTELASALRRLQVQDQHVFELEEAVLTMQAIHPGN
ncbi:MAG: gamma-glutamylcyclotransferase [Pseudomonadales bacterium]|nr:gamma-glutamylcyclotransferase [Pseudomonadales bacterium]